MCGRYTLSTSAKKILERFELESLPADFAAHYNVAPTQNVLALAQSVPQRAQWMRWGMTARSNPKRVIVNARSENLAKNALFRSALNTGRCLIIADGFYEWRRDGSNKVPTHIRLRSHEPFAFAGICAAAVLPDGERREACAVITTPPNPLVAQIHDRMPAILEAQSCRAWIEGDASEPERLLSLLRPFDAASMEAVEVSDAVNKVANDGPQLLEERRVRQLSLRLLG